MPDLDKSLRGSYVRVRVTRRHPTCSVMGGVKEWSEWQTATLEGILGFTLDGRPKLDGQPMLWPGSECEIESVDVLFRPKWNAIRMLCLHCAGKRPNLRNPLGVRTHPIAQQLNDARVRLDQTSGKSFKCSACGTPGVSGICRVPSAYWWVTTETTDEEIERGLASMVFDRKMRDATMVLVLRGVQRTWLSRFEKEGRQSYDTSWDSTRGDFVRAILPEAPPAGWWERKVPIEELRRYATEIRCDHEVIWTRTENSAKEDAGG